MGYGPEMKYEHPELWDEQKQEKKNAEDSKSEIKNPFKEKLDQKFVNNESIKKAFSDVAKEYDAKQIEWYITENFNKKSDADPLLKKFKNLNVDSTEYIQAVWDLRTDIEYYFDDTSKENKSQKQDQKKREIEENEWLAVEDMDGKFQEVFNNFKKINEDRILKPTEKKQKIDAVFSENRTLFERYFATPELRDKKISAARSAPQVKDNVYLLQIFGKSCLSDDIAIDGIYGQQTESVLRFTQREGIGGKKIEWTYTAWQQTRVENYTSKYKQVLEKIVFSTEQETTSHTDRKAQTNKVDLSKKDVSGDALLKNNEGIGKFVLDSNKDDIGVDNLPQSEGIYKKYISEREYAGFLSTAFSELWISDKKDQDAYARCFNKQWDKINDNEKLSKLNAVDKRVKEQTSKRCGEIKKEIATNSNQILRKEIAAWFVNFVKSEIGDKFVMDFSSFDIQKDLEFPWTDNCLKMTAHIKWENGSTSDIVYKSYPWTWERSTTEIIHKNAGKGIEIDKVNNEQKLAAFPWPKWDDLLSHGKKAITTELDRASTMDQFKNSLWKSIREYSVPKDPLAEKMIENAWEKNHAMKKILEVMWYDTKEINLSSERKNSSMYKLFDMLYYSLNYYTADENKKFIALTEEFKNDVLLKYNNPKFQDEYNEKEFGTMAFKREKMEHDRKNLNNVENINSFYAFFSQMVENKKSITDPRYNVISLDKKNHAWPGGCNYESVLKSFKTPANNAPLLKVDQSRGWKELQEQQADIGFVEDIEKGNFPMA